MVGRMRRVPVQVFRAYPTVFALLLVTSCSGGGEGWGVPQQVTPELQPRSPLVFGGERGALALWREETSDSSSERQNGIVATWYRSGRWDEPTILDDYTSYPVTPDAGVNEAGDGIVVWAVDESTGELGQREFRTGLFARRYTERAGWLEPERMGEMPFLPPQTSPHVAIAPDGRAFGLWLDVRPPFEVEELVVAEFDPELGWQAPVRYETGARRLAIFILGIGVDDSDGAVIVWADEEGITASRYSRSAGWREPDPLEEAAPRGLLEVVFDASGVAWLYWGAGLNDSLCPAATRYADGQWEPIASLDSGCQAPSGGGAFAVDSAGRAMAIWRDGFRENAISSWSRYVPGSGWSPAERMPGPKVSQLWGIAALSDGRAAAVSYRIGPTLQAEVWTNQFDSIAGWAEPTLVSLDGPRDSVNSLWGSPSVVPYGSARALGLFLQMEGDVPNSLANTLWSIEFR